MYQSNGHAGGAQGGNGSQFGQQQHQSQPGQQQQQQPQPGQQQQSSNGAAGMAQLVYPALHLQPLNDTFAPKQISLAPPGPQNKIKIGRQTNAKTVPQPSNGYFDSKVLSRMHAEVWSQDGKVFIKDIKSSNGTFINGARLSPEGQESDTFELHSDDMVEFGIDIVGEDNKSIIHHKVACRVFLVMTAEEALGLRHDFAALYRGGIAGSTLNHHVVGPGAEGGFRRSKIGGPGGGYGGTASANGMMSFDHILHRLQAELQKSRETAGELGTLNVAMQDIGETLGGGLPPMQNPPYQHLVPSSTDPAVLAQEEERRQQQANEMSTRAAELKSLEEQVKETQKALQLHIDRLSSLESRLDDNDGIKADILVMREQVRNARNEASEARQLLASRRATAAGEKEDVDFDDAASAISVDTVVPQDADIGRAPVGVDEVDSLDAFGHIPRDAHDSARDLDLLNRLKEHIGPLAPADDEMSALDRQSKDSGIGNDELTRRLEAMENQLERALELGRTLAGQHAEATETVRKLEERVKSLETEKVDVVDKMIKSEDEVEEKDVISVKREHDASDSVSTSRSASDAHADGGILGLLESKWGQWREAFESDFAKERAGLTADREDLRRVVRMWDNLNQEVEDLVEGAQTDDGGAPPGSNDEVQQHEQSKPVETVQNFPGSSSKKKKKNRKGGQGSGKAANTFVANTPTTHIAGVRRTTGAVGLGASAELNRHLRALIYTDDYNLLVRETHLESEGSSSASSSASDTSRSATSKMTDDTSVGSLGSHRDTGEKAANSAEPGQRSVDENGGAGDVAGAGSLDNLPDGVRKRAMAHLAAGRRKGNGRGAARWHDFAGGNGNVIGNGFDGPASLPVLGAAGVVIVGMTAWIMAGKGLDLGGPGGY